MVKPELPSVYDLIVLAGERDPVARATELARERVADGTLLWADRPDLLSLALLLEPEQDLAATCRVWHTFVVAVGDALGGLTAAAYPLHFRFPDKLLFDGFELARVRCVWPEGTGPGDVPPWVVFGLEAQVHEPVESGVQPGRITLVGAGAAEPSARFVEAVARQFLYWLERLERQGFEVVRKVWNQRLEGRGQTGSLRLGPVEAAGVIEGLDAEGLFRIGGRRIGLWQLHAELR